MKYFLTKQNPFSGSTVGEIRRQAEFLLHVIERRTKRTPYVRSSYFKHQKIFITLFWDHLHSKPWKDRVRRLRLVPCAIELLRKTTISPTTKENPNRHDELLHRFGGITSTGSVFYVQVKEEKRNGRKYFMSVFPHE